MLSELVSIGNKYGVTLVPSVETVPETESRVLVISVGDCFLSDLESLVNSGELDALGLSYDGNTREFWAEIAHLENALIDELVDEVADVKLLGYIAQKQPNQGYISLIGDAFTLTITPDEVMDDWKKILTGEDPIRDGWWDGCVPLPTPKDLGLAA